MSAANCRWCGAYLNALDSHDEQTCHDEYQRQVNERGLAKARAALATTRAEIRPTVSYEGADDV